MRATTKTTCPPSSTTSMSTTCRPGCHARCRKKRRVRGLDAALAIARKKTKSTRHDNPPAGVVAEMPGAISASCRLEDVLCNDF